MRPFFLLEAFHGCCCQCGAVPSFLPSFPSPPILCNEAWTQKGKKGLSSSSCTDALRLLLPFNFQLSRRPSKFLLEDHILALPLTYANIIISGTFMLSFRPFPCIRVFFTCRPCCCCFCVRCCTRMYFPFVLFFLVLAAAALALLEERSRRRLDVMQRLQQRRSDGVDDDDDVLSMNWRQTIIRLTDWLLPSRWESLLLLPK